MDFDWQMAMDWLDLAWVPLALLIMPKGQKIRTVCFILLCVFALRLQIELMNEIGYPRGFLQLLNYPLLERGMIAYGTFIAIFMCLLHYSREKDPYVFIAASITVFIVAFCISSFILVL